MIIIKNNDATSDMIKYFRKEIINDTKEIKYFLGINYKNVIKALPIYKRDFNIWIIKENDFLIGFITFQIKNAKLIFIKELYIINKFRRKGYSKYIFKQLINEYKKIEMRVNEGNIVMYTLLEFMGFKGEISKNSCYQTRYPIWWKNF